MADHHHDPDPRLRLRLFVNGKLADETWIDSTDPQAGDIAQATSQLHAAAVAEARDAGGVWLIEVYDPEAAPGAAYVRIGTDTAGMVDPHPLSEYPGVERFVNGLAT